MAGPSFDINDIVMDSQTDILVTSSQPNLFTLSDDTNKSKRPFPDSPDNLKVTIKQKTRQILRRNSVGDVSDKGTEKKTPSLKKSVADIVLEA